MSPEITVSVCIPTRHRPAMLRQCVRSALDQTMPPREIVIGDDSDDDRTERLVRELDLPATIALSYLRNRPPAGVARNIDGVFRRATSDWLLLIHDDDWLLPRAIEHLTRPLHQGAAPDLIYGNQQVADAEGTIDHEASAKLSPAFARTPERAGLQPSALWAAARQQLPNDGFLVRSRLVREVGYLSEGLADCEYAFGVKAAAQGAASWFVDQLVSVYRVSEESLTRGANASHDTSTVDMAATVWRYRRQLAEVADPDLREHLRSIVYRAAVRHGLWQRGRAQALKWALQPRFGVRWWSRQGLGVVSAVLLPRLRERLKRPGKHATVPEPRSAPARAAEG
jgi:glycosyltransferase involved in cell wall biosynthesis